LVYVDSNDTGREDRSENLGHFYLVLLIAVVLQGYDDRSVFGVELCETVYGYDNILKSNRRSQCVTMLYNGLIAAIMNINLDTSDAILKIDEIPFDPGAAGELITREISVMRRVAMVMIQWFFLGHLIVLV
jgi:hypothetical protein